jgi:hypothetical protein
MDKNTLSNILPKLQGHIAQCAAILDGITYADTSGLIVTMVYDAHPRFGQPKKWIPPVSSDGVTFGRTDKDLKNHYGADLPGGNWHATTGGGYSRVIVQVFKGDTVQVKFLKSANQTWCTKDQDIFTTTSLPRTIRMTSNNMIDGRDNGATAVPLASIHRSGLLYFAKFAKSILPQDVVNIIGKMVMDITRPTRTFNNDQTIVTLDPGDTLYIKVYAYSRSQDTVSSLDMTVYHVKPVTDDDLNYVQSIL